MEVKLDVGHLLRNQVHLNYGHSRGTSVLSNRNPMMLPKLIKITMALIPSQTQVLIHSVD